MTSSEAPEPKMNRTVTSSLPSHSLPLDWSSSVSWLIMAAPATSLGAASGPADSRLWVSISRNLILSLVSSLAPGIGLAVELVIPATLAFIPFASDGDDGDWLDFGAEESEIRRSKI